MVAARKPLIIDNNTKDERVWRPVEAYCRQLGERFRFFHVSPLKGFKAGALNFALQQTAPDAEIVGVIDADYLIEPDWLKSLFEAIGRFFEYIGTQIFERKPKPSRTPSGRQRALSSGLSFPKPAENPQIESRSRPSVRIRFIASRLVASSWPTVTPQ